MHAICRTLGSIGLFGALLLPHSQPAEAQSTVSDQEILQELCVLSRDAGLSFVGQIVAIERVGGFVDVTFRVEQQVSGSTTGVRYTMREWAGVWPAGTSRYLVGQRVLAFLHPPSAAGASSPVHGAEGLVPVLVQGANAPRLLDIRRVAASVKRGEGVALPHQDGAFLLDQTLMLLRHGAPGTFPASGLLLTGLRAYLPAAVQPHRRSGPLLSTQNSMQSFQPSSAGGSLHVAR